MLLDIDELIMKLEVTKAEIEHRADLYLQYREAGKETGCRAMEKFMTNARDYLLRDFGVSTAAEVNELIRLLTLRKNGNVQAFPIGGVLLKRNPTDHLESVLTAFGRP